MKIIILYYTISVVIKMEINKTHYKVLGESKKIHVNMTTLEAREKLNIAFKNPTAEDDMTGIFGKYSKNPPAKKIQKLLYTFSQMCAILP